MRSRVLAWETISRHDEREGVRLAVCVCVRETAGLGAKGEDGLQIRVGV